MKYPIRKDILSTLRQAIALIKRKDVPALDELSNHTIKNASIFQDKGSVSIAVVIYALSKIIKRTVSDPAYCKKICNKMGNELAAAKFFLEKEKDLKYKNIIKRILKEIGKLDDKLKLYIEDVLNKAKIVKGSNMYGHGVSIGRAAQLLGISQWELMGYIGKTKIVDQYEEQVISAAARLSYAKKIFNIK